jgi:uncharacterized protein (DUF433 family)
LSKAPNRTPWDGIIVSDPDVCMGKVRIAGTRHYIDHLLASIEEGASFDDIISDYPGLTRTQLQAMLGFTRDLVAGKRNRLKGEVKHD